MAHPAEYFVRYLVISGAAATLDEVNATLEVHGLSDMSEAGFEVCKKFREKIPEDFRPWDSKHRVTVEFARKMKIYSMLFPDAPVREMREKIILAAPVREKIETLLMSGVPVFDVSLQLREIGITVSELAIGEFSHYFWNSTVMGVGNWAEYLRLDSSKRTSPLRDAYHLAVRAGPEAAAYRMGVRKELDGKKIMMEVRAELYHTFLETRSLPLSDKKVEMLGNLARGLAKIDERVQAGDNALQETLRKFEKFKVLHAKQGVPKLSDLAPAGTVSNRSREEIMHSVEKK
jgi:hypothetical protein